MCLFKVNTGCREQEVNWVEPCEIGTLGWSRYRAPVARWTQNSLRAVLTLRARLRLGQNSPVAANFSNGHVRLDQIHRLNKKGHPRGVAFFVQMARPARFERATAWFVARYSIQLSYGRVEGAYYREQVVASQGVKGQAMDATGT